MPGVAGAAGIGEAATALAIYREQVAEYGPPDTVDLMLGLGGAWPLGAERAALARIIAGLPVDQPVTLPV